MSSIGVPVFRRSLTVVTAVVTALLVGATSALACGFLVAENGAIRLDRFTALAAVDDEGTTHYVTAFTYAGGVESFGAIIPLPAEPSIVEAGGEWTLQRLNREVDPPPQERTVGTTAAASSADEAEVIASYEVEALDIDIVRGGGQGVLDWANEQGFEIGVGEDARDMLDFYADRSPFFAAVRYDVDRAAGQDLVTGDGTPVHFAFDTAPWIPLRVLAFDKPAGELVQADLFLLTPEQPHVLTGPGLTPDHSAWASADLLFDLRDDRNSQWIPTRAWLTHYDLAVEAGDLTYDLAVAPAGTDLVEEAAAFGIVEVSAPRPATTPSPKATPTNVVAAPAAEVADDPVPLLPLLAITLLVGTGVGLLIARARTN